MSVTSVSAVQTGSVRGVQAAVAVLALGGTLPAPLYLLWQKQI